MLNRIVFLKIEDKFEVVRLRGKIYFTNYTLCTLVKTLVWHYCHTKIVLLKKVGIMLLIMMLGLH